MWNFGTKFIPRGNLRKLSCKWSRLLYHWPLIIIMRHYGCHYMLFFFIDLDRCYWLGSPECVGFWTSRMQRHRWNPCNPDWFTEWTIWVWLLCKWHMCIWLDVIIMDFISGMIRWWCRLTIACQPDPHVEYRGHTRLLETLRERCGQNPATFY